MGPSNQIILTSTHSIRQISQVSLYPTKTCFNDRSTHSIGQIRRVRVRWPILHPVHHTKHSINRLPVEANLYMLHKHSDAEKCKGWRLQHDRNIARLYLKWVDISKQHTEYYNLVFIHQNTKDKHQQIHLPEPACRSNSFWMVSAVPVQEK